MKPFSILAFDPGRTTGFAEIKVHDTGKGFDLVASYEIAWEDRLKFLKATFEGKLDEPPQIVVEAFRLFPHKAAQQVGSDFPSSQVIGIIEAMHFIYGNPHEVVYQVPVDIAKVAVADSDVGSVAGSPHKIDAYKHARLFFLRNYYFPSK